VFANCRDVVNDKPVKTEAGNDFEASGGVKVEIEGGGVFPEELAGRWRSDKGNWEFVFEPNGVISSSVINLGGAKIVPGRVTRNPARAGGEGVYKPGEWFVYYDPETRELLIEVVIAFFHQDMGVDAAEGNETDILSGTVSEDGELWSASWFFLGRYIAYTPEPREFENTTEPRFIDSLVFEKVENKK
jgi:hypothetical protein